MGSIGVKYNINPQQNLGRGSTQQSTYLQFVPGHVVSVILSPSSVGYSNSRDINAIAAKSHISNDNKSSGSTLKKYYPLFILII